jgi:hypothetical protein
MTEAEAIAKLDAIDGNDIGGAHVDADQVILDLLPPGVQEAYYRVAWRAREWWH